MTKITIFLASSSELKADREQFELFIYRKCKAWYDKHIFLHVDVWEDFFDAISSRGSQYEYNKAIRNSDIFVMLVQNKVGVYSEEEFEHALGQFYYTQRPLIFTYFKPPTTKDRQKLESLKIFEKRLRNIKHYKSQYSSIPELREHFNAQLDKLELTNFSGIDLPIKKSLDRELELTSTPTFQIKGNGNKIIQNGRGQIIDNSFIS